MYFVLITLLYVVILLQGCYREEGAKSKVGKPNRQNIKELSALKAHILIAFGQICNAGWQHKATLLLP